MTSQNPRFIRCGILLAFLMLYYSFSYPQKIYPTGAIFDSVIYSSTETTSPALKFSESYKSSHSLKAYCPTPGDQGSIGTCSSWATGYAALTIAFAIQNNITNTAEITRNAKSAMYLYNQIGNKNTCYGSKIEKNLKVCKTKGDCDLLDFNPSQCQIIPDYKHDQKAGQFRIKDYNTIFPILSSKNQKLSAVINSLCSNKPVIAYLNLYTSFQGLKGNGMYSPVGKGNEIHAVCIIGYDNNSRQFEFINSWGTDWGNGGFFKMGYDDFVRDCDGAFQFSLFRNVNSVDALKGSFELLNFTKINQNTGWPEFATASTVSVKKGVYTLSRTVRKDEFFRLKAKNLTSDTYVYVLTLKPNRKAQILFPLNYSQINKNDPIDIPLITSSDATIELPPDLNNGYTTDLRGEDYMCILYSRNRIQNLDKLLASLEELNDVESWLNRQFGPRLIHTDEIDFQVGEMTFSTKSYSKGDIVPIILKVNVN